jgi:ribosomal protein S5
MPATPSNRLFDICVEATKSPSRQSGNTHGRTNIHLDQTERVVVVVVLQTLGGRCQLEKVVVVGLRDGKMGVGSVLDLFLPVWEAVRWGGKRRVNLIRPLELGTRNW